MNEIDQMISDFVVDKKYPSVFIAGPDSTEAKRVEQYFLTEGWTVGCINFRQIPMSAFPRIAVCVQNARLVVPVVDPISDTADLAWGIDLGIITGIAYANKIPILLHNHLRDEYDQPMAYKHVCDAVSYSLEDLALFQTTLVHCSHVADYTVRLRLALSKLKAARGGT